MGKTGQKSLIMCDIGTNYIKTIKATTLFVVFLFVHSWEQRKLWQLTIWDKKFNGVESYKQVKVIKYPYVLADVFSQIEDMSGTVRLLSTGSYIGYTTKEKAGNNLCYGEIVAIPWGGVANIKYYNGFFVTADNRIATSSNTQVLSNRYLHWWMESNITQIQSTYRGASIQHPSMNDILSLSIYLPSIEEQEQISNKLDTLDNLITLHQRKVFSRFLQFLRQKKHSFLPISWEQRKFNELYEKVSEKNDLTYGTDEIISVANMYFKSDSFITDKEYLRTYNVFHLGDIAFEGNKSKNFAHGRFVENTIGDGIVSHVFDVFRPKIKYDLLFWKYAINNERLMGGILVRSTKASTMMTNLVANDFLRETILVPSLEEQKKIGSILENVDNLITLHQRIKIFITGDYHDQKNK